MAQINNIKVKSYIPTKSNGFIKYIKTIMMEIVNVMANKIQEDDNNGKGKLW